MISYKDSAETKIDIELSDGKKINGILRGSLTDGSPVVVMMHGRPGQANELLQYLGARYLREQDISSLRLNMYDFGDKYRSILECALDTHISDFDTVINYLRGQKVKKIFAIGHSYGGITILGSESVLDGAVLWDPTHGLAFQDPEFDSPDFPEKTLGDVVVGTGGCGYIFSLAQKQYDKKLGDNTDWAANKKYPIKFILAAAGPLAKYARRYYEVASEPKEVMDIKDAHHQFEDSDQVVERLFQETTEWIKKFS